MKRLIWILPLCLVAAPGVWFLVKGSGPGETSARSVTVQRGSVTRSATAVGRIEVLHEVPVKSRSGGILTKLFVQLGQKVQAGDPLAEVRPVLTTQTFLGAERALEMARDGEESAREYLEGEHLAAIFTRLLMGKKNLERMYRGAELSRRQAEEDLKLLKEGKVVIEKKAVDFIVRAPVGGNVLEIPLQEGAPVIPSSSYGSGSVLAILADLSRMVFRGTVDEIDAGRLKEGLAAEITVGALRGAALSGKLTEISLKARERNNAVVFDVRIAVDHPGDVTLRSGYSAVARIEVDRRDDVLVLPERVVEFRQGKAFVQVPDGAGGRAEREIEVGLGDGFSLEVMRGLAEGQVVLERTYE
jgi:HlyD family secretion protein